jgi:ACS family tartrate transporter-like MFS transporter
LGVVNLGVFFGLSGITLWLPQITRAMGFSNLATSFLVALPFVAATFAMIFWGRTGMWRANRFSQVALPALVAALGFAGAALTGSDAASLLSLTLAVIGIYASLSPLINLPASFLGGAAAASGTALVYAIGGVGAFLGPAMIGVLKEETGTYTAAMAALSGALVAAALIVLVLGRMMARPAPRAARAS